MAIKVKKPLEKVVPLFTISSANMVWLDFKPHNFALICLVLCLFGPVRGRNLCFWLSL